MQEYLTACRCSENKWESIVTKRVITHSTPNNIESDVVSAQSPC